jgi:exportin-2 (importin alpha re-exporter)
VLEFVPYVFQILAALLEANPSSPLSDNFKTLIRPLLVPAVWEVRGNVPGLARFLSAIIPKATQVVVATNQLEPILGVFQKLISGKKAEQAAFDILEAVVGSFQA